VGQCPACREKRSKLVFTGPDRLHGTPGAFSYQRCERCRTVFQDPLVLPEDRSLCYPTDYYTHSASGTANAPRPNRKSALPDPNQLHGLRDRLRWAIITEVLGAPPAGGNLLGKALAASRFLRERAFHDAVPDELLPKRPPSRRALEIGCGSGDALISLKRVGWEPEGMEWDPMAARRARDFSGCPVADGDFLTSELPLNTFGLILMSHVFEHLDDPLKALARLRELLAPGGCAVLYYPNPEALGARIFREQWFPWEAPRHLMMPTVGAMRQVAGEAGLEVVQLRTTARRAWAFMAHSHDYLRHREPDLLAPNATGKDFALAWLERAMVGVGIPAGEEVVAVLRKPRGSK
jgi:SAM-dependent methyltransferase